MIKLLRCTNYYPPHTPCSSIYGIVFLFLHTCCVLQTLTHQFWQCTRPSAMCVAATIKRRRCSCAAPSTLTLLHDSSGNVATCSSNRARTTEWTSTSRFTLRYTWTHTQQRHTGVQLFPPFCSSLKRHLRKSCPLNCIFVCSSFYHVLRKIVHSCWYLDFFLLFLSCNDF